jgi:hypothetical protein
VPFSQLTCVWHQLLRITSRFAPGRSVDGGPLPIDELMGVKAVASIDLYSRGLGTKSAIIIAACITGNQHLHELNLSLNKLGKDGAKALAPAIRVSASLTSIDLSDNRIRAEGAKALAPALRDSPSMTEVRAALVKPSRHASLHRDSASVTSVRGAVGR